MVGLYEAKEIVRRAGSSGFLEQYLEVESEVVEEEGREHVGEDRFVHESKNQVALRFNQITQVIPILTR